jgi:PAS domain S-box-containing protein
LIAFQRQPDPTRRVAPWILRQWAAGIFHVTAELEDLEMEPSKRELIESVFAGDSEMATRMRALDWSATLLGPVEEWPQALRTSIRIVLDCARAFEQERQPEIEKLRASEQRLEETSRLYREQQEAATKLQVQVDLLQQLPVAAWTLNPDGTPDFVNRVWLEFAGQTLEFVRSNPEAWMNAVHPEDRDKLIRVFWEGVSSGRGFVFENRSLRAQDGVYRWHLQQAVPLCDADGKVLKFVGTTTDIDDQKRTEESLAELDCAKTTFFSNVSHEFRTPLTLMLGPLEEVLAQERLEPEGHEQLVTVRRNGLRLLKLVNTLLDFSRMEAGRAQTCYQPTDLASFTSEIASAFDSAMKNAGLRFSVECRPIADPVYVDRDMWEKIVLNLLSNAYKFTFEGDVALTLKSVDGAVELEVRDTGVGIPEEHRKHVFERFHRIENTRVRAHEGTGIGLALVQELVKLHGGSVRVESAGGAGSTFTVTIPSGTGHLPVERIQAAQTLASPTIRAEAYVGELKQWLGIEPGLAVDAAMLPKQATLAPSLEPPPSGERELIVLADDNADMRQYLTRLLSERYEVHAAADGLQALEVTRKLRPVLVLADVMMPHLDGFGLLRAIREDSSLASTPVILVSARAGEESRVEGLEADADDYLIKPFAARELLARVAAHVKMANLRRENAEREERIRSEAELEREKLRASEERLAETSRLYRELQQSDAELQLQVALLQQLPVSAWTLKPNGTPDFVNRVWLEFSGQTLDFVRSHAEAWMTAVHPDDREMTVKRFWEGVSSGKGFAFETRTLRAQDGTYRWHLKQAVVLRDAEGKVLKFVGTTTDIDDQKRAEEKLRESEYEARLIVDNMPGAVALLSPTGNLEMVSQQGMEFFGRTVEELSGWGTNDTIHPEDLPGVIDAFTLAFSTGRPYDVLARFRRADGVYRWSQNRGCPIRDRNGDIARWCTLITDIDDLKHAEEALRESEHESRLIVDSIPGLIAVIDMSGEIERVNQPILDYFGRSQEELRQWAVDDTIHPDDRPGYLQAFERSFAAGDPFGYEAVRIRRFDGVYRWLNMRGLPLRDRQGQVVRWYFLLTEVDDRKRAEEALRQAQADLARINRMTTMGELAASLAHEVSQPISGTMTNANACLRSLGSDKPDLDLVRTAVTRIVRDAQRATEIIGRIRSQFEKGALNREVIDVNEVNRETVALLRDEAMRYNISVRTELAADLPQIVGDRVQLQQVVMNLIVNSIEAMKDVDGIREMLIKSQRGENEQIVLSVSDTGIGLPPQLAEQIFDAFFTTKPHGTGMGLRISRSIIESHGGRLWAAGSPGRGATFHLNLPAALPSHR